MKTRMCRLEFAITGMADLRFLYRAWDKFWAIEDRGNTESILVDLTVDDRLPGEEVSLNFHATPEVLERFLGILEQGWPQVHPQLCHTGFSDHVPGRP